ncbi:MAG: bifunctional phosphoglucose/phosphomannose isomerase [archaeon GB-1867-005]|nr:bifunctional phosphoglucose/phosphomannose isomerase [Candidatus Culexmicrobium cathedralense]
MLPTLKQNEMYLKAIETPKHLERALNQLEIQGMVEGEVDNIVIAGMGGSGVIGNIILDWLEDSSPIPIITWKNYGLPAWADTKTYVLAISYSGNTEEVISAVAEALKRKCKLTLITSNGILENLASSRKIPIIRIPKGYQPREALPYLLTAAIIALDNLEIIGNWREEMQKTIETLKRIKEELENKPEIARQIAEKIKDHQAIIYAYKPLRGAALRFKQQLNENGKSWAKVEIIPEAGHNEIVGWRAEKNSLTNLKAIFIRDVFESKMMNARISAFKEEIERAGVEAIDIKARGREVLSRIMSVIYLCDLTSIYLALIKGVDPSNIEPIKNLKEKIKSTGYLQELMKQLEY